MTSLLLKNLKFLFQHMLCFKKGEKMQEEIDNDYYIDKIEPPVEEISKEYEEFSSEKSPDSQSK